MPLALRPQSPVQNVIGYASLLFVKQRRKEACSDPAARIVQVEKLLSNFCSRASTPGDARRFHRRARYSLPCINRTTKAFLCPSEAGHMIAASSHTCKMADGFSAKPGTRSCYRRTMLWDSKLDRLASANPKILAFGCRLGGPLTFYNSDIVRRRHTVEITSLA
jgi:hypothetical protein